MKKTIIITTLILLIILIITKCQFKKEIKKEETKGVFISYIDYSKLKGKNEKEQKQIINNMIEKTTSLGLNTIILQVRPFADAIYESKVFPASEIVTENKKLNFDILKYFINKSKEKNIKIYAWVNPYRISNDINKNSSFIEKYKDIICIENGIYLNPSKEESLKLILKGIEEIAKNYDINAIIYDDYFYPDISCDKKNTEDIKTFRINIINNLLKETNKIIKKTNKNILFGISPSGNIENNLNNEYLDLEEVIKNKYIDFVIPQLYYGFDNQNKPFVKTLKVWNNYNINMYIALSLYKSGTIDKFAGTGSNEWIENDNILKRQIITSRNFSNYKGFFIFRYSYLEENNNSNLKNEINNIEKIIK